MFLEKCERKTKQKQKSASIQADRRDLFFKQDCVTFFSLAKQSKFRH